MSLLARTRSKEYLHVEEKFVFSKSNMEVKVEFEPGFSYEDFTKAVDMITKATEDHWYMYEHPVCYYRNPAPVFYRNKTFLKTEFQCRFFYAKGSLAYTPSGRTGWYIEDMSYHMVEKIVVRHHNHPDLMAKKEVERDKLWNRIQKARYDEQTWSNLSKDNFKEDKHPFYYIKHVFNKRDMERIKKAFETKSQFRIFEEKEKRLFSAEGRICDDGIYRAWFSSEDKEDGHGDYYFLLNPTTAVFCEKD